MQNPSPTKPVLLHWAGPDGEWLRHPSWDATLADLPDPTVGRVALERLREEFTPKWSISTTEHPVQVDKWMLAHRLWLLEMGHVLATGCCRGVRHRLRHPREYLGMRAELLAGSLFLGAGAALRHEPHPPRATTQTPRRSLRPDWRAEWRDGFVHVEVKLSHTSVQANAREVWGMLFSGEFQASVGHGLADGEGVWATLRMNESFLDAFGNDFDDRGPMQLVARRTAAAFAAMLQRHLLLGAARGTFVLVSGLDVEVRPRPDGRAGLTIDGSFYVSDEHRVTLRLRTHLKEAAEQLDEMPGGRVVLIDTFQDSALRKPAAIVHALLSETWADRIAAVMIVYRHNPYTRVDVVHGRALDADPVSHLITSKLRRCNRGHLHAEVRAMSKAPDLTRCEAWE